MLRVQLLELWCETLDADEMAEFEERQHYALRAWKKNWSATSYLNVPDKLDFQEGLRTRAG